MIHIVYEGKYDDKMSKIQLRAGICIPKTTRVSMRKAIEGIGAGELCQKACWNEKKKRLYRTLHVNQPSRINFLEVASYTIFHLLRRLARLRCDHKPDAFQLDEPRMCQRAPE